MNIKTLFLLLHLAFHYPMAGEMQKDQSQATAPAKPLVHCNHCKKEILANNAMPWIGLYASQISKALASQLSIKHGCVVLYTIPNGPSSEIGIQKYDVITKFDNKDVTVFKDVESILKTKSVGDKVEIQLIRGGKHLTQTISLIKKPEAHRNLKTIISSQGKIDIKEIKLDVINDLKLTTNQHRDLLNQLGMDANSDFLKQVLDKSNKENVLNAKHNTKHTKTITTVYDKGKITIKLDNGKQRIVVQDLDGVVQYEGGFNTKEERKKVSADIRKRTNSLLTLYKKLSK